MMGEGQSGSEKFISMDFKNWKMDQQLFSLFMMPWMTIVIQMEWIDEHS